MHLLRVLLLALLIALAYFAMPVEAQTAKHVVVVGMDGLRTDAVDKADTPNMKKLIAEGAYAEKVESVMPSVSTPNWAAILMGAGPDTTGITSNDWKPGPGPLFPTIFNALHAQQKDATIAAIYEWGGFGNIFDHADTTISIDDKQAAEGRDAKASAAQHVAEATADCILKNKPTLTFIHFDLIDHAGHGKTYGSPAYLEVVAEADRYLGLIMDAVNKAGIAADTVIMVVSDHGGIGTGHGGGTKQERQVPWMVSGPGIAKGKALPDGISVTQTAPTLARILQINAPAEWVAKPVEEIFAK